MPHPQTWPHASPFMWFQFDAAGALKPNGGQDAVQQLQALLRDPDITDVVVLAHGWKNDEPVASALYATLWGHVAQTLTGSGRDPNAFAVVGLLWPAKKYDSHYDGAEMFATRIDEGRIQAQAEALIEPTDLDEEAYDARWAEFAKLVGTQTAGSVREAADQLKNAYPQTGVDPALAQQFLVAAKSALDRADTVVVDEPDAIANIFARQLTREQAEYVVQTFSGPMSLELSPTTGHALGLGDRITAATQGIRTGICWVLNQFTYHTMKMRAGAVGQGLAHALAQVKPPRPTRLHLVGHSFGGRLVTAAVADQSLPGGWTIHGVILLQAAYSHYGMTKQRHDGKPGGPFAAVLAPGRVRGPLVVTHTHNDKACTILYPMASRLLGDTTQALGDENDEYGAMGANGPQELDPLQIRICGPAAKFELVAGQVNTVLADSFVVRTDAVDAHNNVTNARCGALVAATLIAGAA